MAESFIGQIQVFPYNFVPRGWALCNGSLLQIGQNTALFAIIGTYYGGDGRTTFAIPNLLGRASYGAGSGGPPLAAATGTMTVTLDNTHLPSHTHSLNGTTQPGTLQPAANNAFATTATVTKSGGGTGFNRYSTSAANTAMASGSIALAGAGSPHNNMQPYLGMNYYICLSGIFPPRP